MEEVYKICCEYDIGAEDFVFSSHQIAEEYAKQYVDEYLEETFEELEENGLIYIESVTVISK